MIPRYGIDIGKLFVSNGRKLPTKLVNRLAVQMVFNYKINKLLYIYNLQIRLKKYSIIHNFLNLSRHIVGCT